MSRLSVCHFRYCVKVAKLIVEIVSLSGSQSLQFLADRTTTGRAYATVMLQSSSVVCLSVCTECIVAKHCVLEQKLLLLAYRKSYMRKR